MARQNPAERLLRDVGEVVAGLAADDLERLARRGNLPPKSQSASNAEIPEPALPVAQSGSVAVAPAPLHEPAEGDAARRDAGPRDRSTEEGRRRIRKAPRQQHRLGFRKYVVDCTREADGTPAYAGDRLERRVGRADNRGRAQLSTRSFPRRTARRQRHVGVAPLVVKQMCTSFAPTTTGGSGCGGADVSVIARSSKYVPAGGDAGARRTIDVGSASVS